tara:strand:- start:1187 stop:1447 length:261 start_codon:yes stop_codon:yes gene_type:complete
MQKGEQMVSAVEKLINTEKQAKTAHEQAHWELGALVVETDANRHGNGKLKKLLAAVGAADADQLDGAIKALSQPTSNPSRAQTASV